jgi:hypothetical protein
MPSMSETDGMENMLGTTQKESNTWSAKEGTRAVRESKISRCGCLDTWQTKCCLEMSTALRRC